VTALGVTRHEQLPVVGWSRRPKVFGKAVRAALSPSIISRRLLSGVQERMIAERRDIVAGVVRPDDDITLRREHRRYERAFGVRRVGDNPRGSTPYWSGSRARKARSGAGPGARRRGTRRHHESARGHGDLASPAERIELDVVEVDAAGRGAGELQ